MENTQLLNTLRDSALFLDMKDTMKRKTGIDLWLDSADADDPNCHADEENIYYKALLSQPKLKTSVELSHQAMRNSAKDKNIKYADGVTGLIHCLIPLHRDKEEIAFLRCGGIRDTYKGTLKFMNFAQELREDHYDEAFIKELEKGFHKIPNLHGEDLAEAVDYLTVKADILEKQIVELCSTEN